MEYPKKFVRFDKYCETCKHKKVDEYEDPCNECLDNPVNDHTDKPIKYELEEKKGKQK